VCVNNYVFWKLRGIELYLLLCVLIIMFFGNYMWIPECFLAFWLVLSLGEEKQGIKVLKNKKYYSLVYGIIIAVFIILNIYYFNDLHPKTWAKIYIILMIYIRKPGQRIQELIMIMVSGIKRKISKEKISSGQKIVQHNIFIWIKMENQEALNCFAVRHYTR